MSGNYFCPYCLASMPPIEYRDGGQLRFSCRNCGYPIESAALQRDPAPAPRPKVLCIDDDKLLLGLFVNILEANDFEALTASDGATGIALARQERPDVVLVDVMMPGMTGFDVCKVFRADPDWQRTPIIVMTALTDARIEPKARQAGASLVLQKPHDAQRLIQAIRETLAASREAPPA